MSTRIHLIILITSCFFILSHNAKAQWDQWRGSASGDGVIPASDSTNMPMTWSKTKNVLWKTPVPGVGYSSPIIIGNKVILTTADHEKGTQSVLCYDATSGKELWAVEAFKGTFFEKNHKMNANASATSASDGKQIYSFFGINDAIHAIAHDLNGKEIWKKKISDFTSQFGVGASPLYYDGIVVFPVENKPVMKAYGYDTSGKQKWTINRKITKWNSWHTPRIFEIDGQPQLIFSGHKLLTSYDYKTGKENWKIDGGASVTVGSVVKDGNIIYASGGHPEKLTVAYDISAKKELWQNRLPTYISSVVTYKGRLYAATNNGKVACLNGKTGEEIWSTSTKMQLTASPFVANDHLFFITEDGTTHVAKTDTDTYEKVHTNTIPGLTRATPSIVKGKMYYRGEKNLYCIGQ